ncbi:MAG: hypothetical protein ACOC8E_00045 [Planctomycetota bacterium]
MKSVWTWAIAGMLAFAMCASPALAREGKGRGEGRGRRRACPRHLMRAPLVDELDLGEKQKEKIKELREAARDKIRDADSREERHKLIKQLRKDVHAVLTEDQLGQLEKLRERSGGHGPGTHHRKAGRHGGVLGRHIGRALDLGEKQKEKIKELREAARDKIRDADSREERHKLIKQLRKDVHAVLTEDQLGQLEKLRERSGGHGPGTHHRKAGRRGRGPLANE